ncbi:MAG: NAD(P)H-hydrate dehydratase [Casimicrobiaceae bacterium]
MTHLAPILPTTGIRTVEKRLRSCGLMERAGAAAADVARSMAAGRGGPVVVLAGPGNNGGDAFVVARLLAEAFFDVVTVFRSDPHRLPADAAAAREALAVAGLLTQPDPPDARPALVVDGLFGIGLGRPPGADYAALISWATGAGAPVLALDVPSGVDADTGAVPGAAIRADATATFIALKPGLCTGAGLDHAGVVSLHTLGAALEAGDGAGSLLAWSGVALALPPVLGRKRRDVHKGSFGTLAIVGGADGMTGAPILAGRAALMTGAGKVLLGLAAAARPPVDWGAPELMLRDADAALASGADALVVGPGLGVEGDAASLVARAARTKVPLVLDADALNLVARDKNLRDAVRNRAAPTLITPHPAEAARLLGVDTARVGADRVAAARSLAADLHALTVLKGAGSVLAYPGGSFDINGSGGPALATAGSGDVLAGILGALLAQGLAPDDALRVGVCLHGAAADARVAAGVGPLGLTASELADAARALLNAAAR